MQLILFSKQNSPRLAYTLETIFKTFLKVDYQFTTDSTVYKQSNKVRINYSNQALADTEVHIPAHFLLFEAGLSPIIPKFTEQGQRPALFPKPSISKDYTFDLFSLVFYLISRYEEYISDEVDQYGRFEAKNSLAVQCKFNRRPLVDEWIADLVAKIQYYFQGFQISKQDFQFQATYDIDLAYAFLNKGITRNILSLGKKLKDGHINDFHLHTQVLMGLKKDPYDTFHYLDQLHSTYQLSPNYFFLLANYGPYDKNISHRSSALINLIKQIAEQYTVGIHPSYASNTKPQLLTTEINRLEDILGQKITNSRQHYLKLRFPDTYQGLLKAGITADFTMGYADEIGFRASTSHPFYWYDLTKESSTKLLLHSFQVMDVSLKSYLKYRPEQALEEVKALIKEVRQVNGTFSTLWHNSSFSSLGSWENWKSVYEAILKSGTE